MKLLIRNHRLLVLIVLLVGVFFYTYFTDERTPAYPNGRFWDVTLTAAAVVVIEGAVLFTHLIRRRPREPRSDRPGP